jgi:hypothetical protein
MQPSKIDGSYDNQAGSHRSSQSSLGEAYNSESGESLNKLHHRNNLIEATGLQENRHLRPVFSLTTYRCHSMSKVRNDRCFVISQIEH